MEEDGQFWRLHRVKFNMARTSRSLFHLRLKDMEIQLKLFKWRMMQLSCLIFRQPIKSFLVFFEQNVMQTILLCFRDKQHPRALMEVELSSNCIGDKNTHMTGIISEIKCGWMEHLSK
jgi:hypothetical protein